MEAVLREQAGADAVSPTSCTGANLIEAAAWRWEQPAHFVNDARAQLRVP